MDTNISGNNGHRYEIIINSKLREDGLLPEGFKAGGSSSNPDAIFKWKDVEFKTELKERLYVDFGQSTLKYDKETGKWTLHGKKNAEATRMREMLKTCGVEEFTNEKWGPHGAPRKGSIKNKNFTPEDVEHDKSKFVDHFMDIPSSVMYDYYQTKDTYYIQVKGYGFYYLHSDPLNLGVPKFDAQLQVRIRRKSGGNSKGLYNYRFATAIVVKENSPPSVKSPYDIGKCTKFLRSE